MIEAWLATPIDDSREIEFSKCLELVDGRETYRELELNSICVTIEFDSWVLARTALPAIQQLASHTEGPVEYGND